MNKLKMTNNEYQQFAKKCANKIFDEDEPNYGYKEYVEDLHNVDIIPFELSEFNLPKDIEKSINNIFESDAIEDNHRTLTGFSESEDEWYEITDKLKLKRFMGYYYSGYCYNNDLNMYMTYTEGDLYLKLFRDKNDYEKSLKETIEWYENN